MIGQFSREVKPAFMVESRFLCSKCGRGITVNSGLVMEHRVKKHHWNKKGSIICQASGKEV